LGIIDKLWASLSKAFLGEKFVEKYIFLISVDRILPPPPPYPPYPATRVPGVPDRG